MKFDAIVAPTIGELFIQRMQDMILSGELAIGEKLPTEQELAETMQISKSAVHIGVKELERQGFLRIVPRHGVYVENYLQKGNIETLVALLHHSGDRMDRQTVTSILQFREGNEGMAVKLLSAHHTPEDIACLREYITLFREAAEKSTPDMMDLSQKLHEYHLCIGLRSGNYVIPMVMNAFHDVGIVFWRIWLRIMGVDTAIEFLNAFTDCIETGNGDAAMELYRNYSEIFLKAYP